MSKHYVIMTDTFMSGWGHARGKINKLIFECSSFEEAQIVSDNAECRSDQVDIKILSVKPLFSSPSFYGQFKTIDNYPSWYKKDFFLRK